MENGLVEKCDECLYCPFLLILTKEQRRRENLSKHIERKGIHPHIKIIEEICSSDGYFRDLESCDMKKVALRASYDDFMMAQFNAIIRYCNDLAKGEAFIKEGKYRKVSGIEMRDGFLLWTKQQELGRGSKESFAERFREVWNMGLREFNNGNSEPVQILGEIGIYEIVINNGETYNHAIETLKLLNDSYYSRNMLGIPAQKG